MSIQRYITPESGALFNAHPDGIFVTYADHVAAVAEAERQVLSRLGEWQKHSPLGGKTYAQGYAAALDAARDAVAALRDENRQGTDPEWGVLNAALAAIDALRGES